MWGIWQVRGGKGELEEVEGGEEVCVGMGESVGVVEGEVGGEVMDVGMDEGDGLDDDGDGVVGVEGGGTGVGVRGLGNEVV